VVNGLVFIKILFDKRKTVDVYYVIIILLPSLIILLLLNCTRFWLNYINRYPNNILYYTYHGYRTYNVMIGVGATCRDCTIYNFLNSTVYT